MKLYSLSMLCLSLLLLNTPFSLTKGRRGRGRTSGGKRTSLSSHGGTNTGYKPQKDSNLQGGYPKQNNQGSPGQQGNYPRQPGAGSNPNQYPGQGSPYGGYGGSYGVYGTGYGGYRGNGPSEKSRGFARSAVAAAAGGGVAGMALGYGIGQLPHPHFNVRSPQEEYYYKHYMYRNYGSQSTSTNTKSNTNRNTKTNTNTNTNTNEYNKDKAGDDIFTQPIQSYDDYMDACMKRSDILPVKTQKPQNKPGASATATTKTNTSTAVTAESNDTATENPSTPTPTSPGPPNQPEDDDTVSIVEIGYPALIKQVKTRRCLELYMAYSVKYMRQEGREDWSTGGVEGLAMGFQRLLAVVTSALLVLLNSNVHVLLH